jgi:uncharacterized delta-60 repeat protein
MNRELLALLATVPFTLTAQDGVVDPTFADNAVYALVNHTEVDDDILTRIAVMPDGRIVLAGNMSAVFNNQIIVVRLLPDGTRDNSFGTDGVSVIDLSPNLTETLTSMVLQGEKIILAGDRFLAGGRDFFVMRLNADGEVDLTFGGLGVTIVDVGNGTDDRATNLRVDGQGRLLLCGSAEDPDGPNGADLAVVRFTADGQVDDSFNGTGRVIWPVVNAQDVAKDIVFDDQQRILLVGEAVSSGQRRIVVAALNDDGSKYFEYGGSMLGRVVLPAHPSADAYVERALIDPNGNIMVVGSGFFVSTINAMMAQVSPAGTLTSFGGNGVVFFIASSVIHDIMKVQGGYLVCGHEMDNDLNMNTLIARVSEDAVPVETFADNGRLVVDLYLGGNDRLWGIAAQGTQHAVVVGNANSTQTAHYGFAFRITVDGLLTGMQEHGHWELGVYPNPTDGLLQLPGELPINALVEVVDLRGAVVMRTTLSGTRQLDVQALAPGLYTLLVDRAAGARFVRD